MFVCVSEFDIVNINKAIEGEKHATLKPVGGVLSSYEYYDNVYDKISSIVIGIIKGHNFRNGNKRTGLLVFLALCELNNITIPTINYFDIIINISSNNYSVNQVSKLFFKNELQV